MTLPEQFDSGFNVFTLDKQVRRRHIRGREPRCLLDDLAVNGEGFNRLTDVFQG